MVFMWPSATDTGAYLSEVKTSKTTAISRHIARKIQQAKFTNKKLKNNYKVKSTFSKIGPAKRRELTKKQKSILRNKKLSAIRKRHQQRKNGVFQKLKPNYDFIHDEHTRLTGIRQNGNPIYYTTRNLNAAVTMGVDEIKQSPLNLSGAGLTIGIWDSGDVFTNHAEFEQTPGGTSLIALKDSVGVDGHATHVAGTLMAQGINSSAEGMANGANLDSYDFEDDISEMSSAVYNQFSGLGLLTSNHSYGIAAGWFFINVDGASSVSGLKTNKIPMSSSNSSVEIKTPLEKNDLIPIENSSRPSGLSVVFLNTNESITDNQSDVVDLGTDVILAPSIERNFRMTNTGDSDLTFSSYNAPDGITLTAGGDSAIAPGNFDTFTFVVDTSVSGTTTGDIVFQTNLPGDGIFSFPVTTFVDPEVWVWAGDTTISEVEDSNFGRYGQTSKDYDDICHSSPFYTMVLAAGNDRADDGPTVSNPHHLVLQPGTSSFVASTTVRNPDNFDSGYDTLSDDSTAKNPLVIGAIPSISGGYSNSAQVTETTFSSYGPVDDGRIKPDLVAPGVNVLSTGTSLGSYDTRSGTSMATPAVAGSVALLKSLYQTTFSNLPLNSTVKALLVHTANEAGPSLGPDYKFGWGLVNAKGAADLIVDDGGSGDHFIESTLANGQTKTYSLTTSGETVKITIAWNDFSGNVSANSLDSATRAIINDLNIVLKDANGTSFFPWRLDLNNPASAATRGINNKDNVEKIELDFTPAAFQNYTLEVSHAGVLNTSALEPEQDFSLILEGFSAAPSASNIKVTSSSTGNTQIIDNQASPIDLGTIAQGLQATTYQFLVENTGNVDLTISNLTVPTGFIIVKNISSTLTAGQTDTFEIRLDSSSIGTFQGHVEFTTNVQGQETFNFAIQGTVTSTSSSGITVQHNNSLTVLTDGQSSTLDLGNESVGASPTTHTFTISNTGNSNLTISNLQVPTGFTILSAPSTTVSSGNSTTFTLNVDNSTAGIKSGTLSFETNVSGMETFNFNISSTVFDSSSLSMTVTHTNTGSSITNNQGTSINMGSVFAGSTALSQIFTISNTGSSEVVLSNLVIPTGYLIIATLPTSVPAFSSRSFQLRLDSSNLGVFAGNVSFTTNVPGNEVFSFPITGEVSTLTASALVTYDNQGVTINDDQTSIVDLGDEIVGATSNTHVFTVTNAGNSTLNLANLSLPAGFILVEGLSGSLASGQSDKFQISVDTSTIGTYAGTLSFETNVPSQNPFNFIIQSQVASVPSFGFSLDHANSLTSISNNVTTIDFGTENQFSASTVHTFTLKNLGANTLFISNVSIPSGIIISRNFKSSIEFGESTTLEIRMGTFFTQTINGTISFSTNDPSNSTFTYNVLGVVEESNTTPQNSDDPSTSLSSREVDSPLTCGTISDGQGPPSNGPFQVLFGFAIAFVFFRLRKLY